MGNRSKAEVDADITAAARLFAKRTRDAKKIAKRLNTSERNVHRWAKTERWEQTLQKLGYTGERNFRIKPRRSKEALVTAAACLFAKRTRDAKKIAKRLNTAERNVREWAKEDLWEETLQSLNYKGERKFKRKPRQS